MYISRIQRIYKNGKTERNGIISELKPRRSTSFPGLRPLVDLLWLLRVGTWVQNKLSSVTSPPPDMSVRIQICCRPQGSQLKLPTIWIQYPWEYSWIYSVFFHQQGPGPREPRIGNIHHPRSFLLTWNLSQIDFIILLKINTEKNRDVGRLQKKNNASHDRRSNSLRHSNSGPHLPFLS